MAAIPWHDGVRAWNPDIGYRLWTSVKRALQTEIDIETDRKIEKINTEIEISKSKYLPIFENKTEIGKINIDIWNRNQNRKTFFRIHVLHGLIYICTYNLMSGDNLG